jgi:hypothetical protein
MPLPEEMQSALEQFDTDCEKVVKQFLSSLGTNNTNKTLYHYTNDQGLLGILRNGSIWLTDGFKLNDPSEFKHGLFIASKILAERGRNGPEELKTFAMNFNLFLSGGGVESVTRAFVACFSATDDDLGQWRSYADNGRGFALCFEREALENAFAKESSPPTVDCSTFSVEYNDAKVSAICEEIFRNLIPAISLPRKFVDRLDSLIVK